MRATERWVGWALRSLVGLAVVVSSCGPGEPAESDAPEVEAHSPVVGNSPVAQPPYRRAATLPPPVNPVATALYSADQWSPERIAGAVTRDALAHLVENALAVPSPLADADPDALREQLRHDLALRAIAPIPLPALVRTLDAVQVEGVSVTRLEYLVEPGLVTQALWLESPSARDDAPVILFLHGHGPRPIDAVAGLASVEHWPYQDRAALELARAGYRVFAPELRSFGSSGNDDREVHERYVQVRHLAGHPMLGVYVVDTLRAAEILEQTRGIPPERIALAGVSTGGAAALLSAAVEPRFSGVHVSSWAPALPRTFAEYSQCDCQYAPGFGVRWRLEGLASLIAPRALVLSYGEDDGEFPHGDAAAEEVTRAYAESPDALVVRRLPGGHQWDGQAAAEGLGPYATR